MTLLAGQPPAPPWRNEHRDATTTYRHYDDGRVSIVAHRRVESVGWSVIEVFGATKAAAEAAWRRWLDERNAGQVRRSHRRAKWGLSGGWQT